MRPDPWDSDAPRRIPMRNKLRAGITLLALGGLLAEAVMAALPDASLYQLRSAWTTDAGQKMRLAELRGKPRLFVMFFAHCQSVCPMTLGRLKSLEAALPPDWGNRAGFVLVTLDPRRDDSGALAEYRKDGGLRRDRYT